MKNLSIKEAAERLGVSGQTIRRWAKEGEFPNAYRSRPSSRTSPFCIPLSDIEDFEARRYEHIKKQT